MPACIRFRDYIKNEQPGDQERKGSLNRIAMMGISFSWNIHFKCNYRCPYCWFHGEWQEFNKHNRYFSLAELITAWKNIYRKYDSVHIDILGGEPFIYPNFMELINKLSELHTITISTNLSGDIATFVKQINCERVKIVPTFHPLFAKVDNFVQKMSLLKENGFGSRVSYLAYPPQLKLFKYYRKRFEEEGYSLGNTPFWGEYKERRYPEGYTEEERKLINFNLGKRAGEPFQLNSKKEVKGKLCRAGQRYALIHADGRVYRCGSFDSFKTVIGNFFDKNFKLLDKPLPCNSEYCPCNELAFLLIEKDEANSLQVSAIHEKDEQSTTTSLASPLSLTELKKGPSGPKFIRNEPPYKIHWNWEITHKCNYRCSYCHFWKNCKEHFSPIEVKRWQEIWDNIFCRYGCSHIRLSGGEPTLYPNFFDLITVLLENHTVDITTNLSFDINYLIEKVTLEPLLISPSFHPEFDKIKDFLQKISILRKHRFLVTSIAYVAFPPHLRELKEAMKITEENEIDFKIIPFQGEHDGKTYPQDYNDEEKRLLREAAVSSRSRDLNMKWLNWHVQEGHKDDKKKAISSTVPNLCRMGQMYAKLGPNGNVTRCCHPESEILGNIFDNDFRILDEPKSCTLEHCPCFKAMFVGEEQVWLPHWGSPEHPRWKNNVCKIEDEIK